LVLLCCRGANQNHKGPNKFAGVWNFRWVRVAPHPDNSLSEAGFASDTGKVPGTQACKIQLPHAGATILWIVATQVWRGTASLHLLVVDQRGVSGIAEAGLWH
jgi:hypothetical protein